MLDVGWWLFVFGVGFLLAGAGFSAEFGEESAGEA
jgi:hypothetical protein